MTVSGMMRIGFVAAGLFVMAKAFWLYAQKRLAVEIAMAWEAAGAGLAVVGLVPLFSGWCGLLSDGTAAAVFLCGAVVIWAGMRFSMLLSSLQMKMQELAVQVSLLREENRSLAETVRGLRGHNEDGGA